MLRIVHALLLIATLLTCPYRCAGGTRDEGGACTPQTSCSCCAAPCAAEHVEETCATAERQERIPSAPGEDCQCRSCFCEGAVLTDETAPTDAAAPSVLRHPADEFALLPHLAPWPVHPTSARGDEPARPLQLAGRPLRLVFESLQI